VFKKLIIEIKDLLHKIAELSLIILRFLTLIKITYRRISKATIVMVTFEKLYIYCLYIFNLFKKVSVKINNYFMIK